MAAVKQRDVDVFPHIDPRFASIPLNLSPLLAMEPERERERENRGFTSISSSNWSSSSLWLIKRRRKIRNNQFLLPLPVSQRRKIRNYRKGGLDSFSRKGEEEERTCAPSRAKNSRGTVRSTESGRTPAVSSIHNHGFDLADGEAI